MMAIPPTFDEAFLSWFRSRTEAYWQIAPLDPEPEEGMMAWSGWHGTKWLPPLADEEVQRIEAQFEICFPPDYRLFYRMLHATDRPRVKLEPPSEYSSGLFYDWQHAPSLVQGAYKHILGTLAFSVVHSPHAWNGAWGEFPNTQEEARGRLQPHIRAAPRLIPLYLHRFLLAEPCEAGNPVLSIWGADMIIYAPDLRTYLLREFGRSALCFTRHRQQKLGEEIQRRIEQGREQYKAIPFWGEYLFY
jgi:hypothetical protein